MRTPSKCWSCPTVGSPEDRSVSNWAFATVRLFLICINKVHKTSRGAPSILHHLYSAVGVGELESKHQRVDPLAIPLKTSTRIHLFNYLSGVGIRGNTTSLISGRERSYVSALLFSFKLITLEVRVRRRNYFSLVERVKLYVDLVERGIDKLNFCAPSLFAFGWRKYSDYYT